MITSFLVFEGWFTLVLHFGYLSKTKAMLFITRIPCKNSSTVLIFFTPFSYIDVESSIYHYFWRIDNYKIHNLD